MPTMTEALADLACRPLAGDEREAVLKMRTYEIGRAHV